MHARNYVLPVRDYDLAAVDSGQAARWREGDDDRKE